MTPRNTGPVLSVTVLNYNYGRFLPQCLDSILGQLFGDFELILIDDCSTDDSLRVIEPYLSDPRVRLIHHRQNKGWVCSLLEGVQESAGRYLTVISADDLVLSGEAFLKQIALLESAPTACFCYSAWNRIDRAGRLGSTTMPWINDHVWSGEEEFRHFCTGHYILHSGTIIRRAAYDSVGGYDTSFVYTLDNALWALLCGEGEVAYVSEPLYAYRTHGSNLSHRPEAMWPTIREFVCLIERGFEGLPDCATRNDLRLRRRGRQAALMSMPTMQVFAGNYLLGLRALAYAVWLRPFEALLQPRVVALVGRTLLGEAVYRWVHRTVNRARRRQLGDVTGLRGRSAVALTAAQRK